MTVGLFIASAVVVALWAWLAALLPRALRRVPRIDATGQPRQSPLVSVVVPARNEEKLLPGCLAALAAQDFTPLEVVVVDDHSSDGTRQVAEAARGVRLVLAPERPAGWAGKCWAAWQGARAARGEWLLFLDADALTEPACLRATLADAQRAEADLLAAMPRADCASTWEALAQPVMLFLLLWHLHPERVNDPRDPTAAAPGSFLFFRRVAYEKMGGHEAVRGQVVEDLKLAQLVKQSGLKLRLAAAPHLVATRRPLTRRELWNGWCRVAVDGLGRRAGLGLLGGFAVAVAFLLPYAVAPLGWAATGLAAVHLLLARLVRLQLARAWGIDDRLAWLQPLGALFAVAVLLRAALAARTGGARVEWRGRDYAA